MAKTIELMRHTANDGDVLTPDGIAAAIEIGQSLTGGYQLMASSGAQRATQTIACLLAASNQHVPAGVIVEPGLRSQREDQWRAAFRTAGAGDLRSLQQADPDLVRDDMAVLAAGVRRIFARIEEGQRALAVGHSPTLEAAVLGLTGRYIDSLGKGERIVIIEDASEYAIGA